MRNAIRECVGRGPTHLDNPRCHGADLWVGRGGDASVSGPRKPTNKHSGPSGWKLRRVDGAGLRSRDLVAPRLRRR